KTAEHRRRTLNFEKRKALHGLLFCSPFIVGFLGFFLIPMIQSIRYAFSTVKLDEAGMTLTFVGLKNFKEALFADPLYVRTILESLRGLVVQVPSILIFSLFVALILNQKFRGRVVARAVFFLPVIVVSGVVLEILQMDDLSQAILSGDGFRFADESENLFAAIGMPSAAVDLLAPVMQSVFSIVWGSGVQILMFLAGLQTVPPALYECAKIEGATAWETFWKVTFPMISPMILMNIVYTSVDYFTTSVNPVIRMIAAQSSNMHFEYAAGLSWMYLIVVLLMLGIVYKILNKRIVYVVD
ncbi:MAG: sugar ABC transporter permease, partial [Clostridiales Family XIII bacterium]|nr:sugar ABC transporter permease [Clostridiales Family XIII bacterium]